MRAKNAAAAKGVKTMDFLIIAGVFVFWIILQVWVLPRFGVQT